MEDPRDLPVISRVSIHSSSSSFFPLWGSYPPLMSISSSSPSSPSLLISPISFSKTATSSLSHDTSRQLFPASSAALSPCVCPTSHGLRKGLSSSEKKVRERPRASSYSTPSSLSSSLFSFSFFLSSCPTSPPEPISLSCLSSTSPQIVSASSAASSPRPTIPLPPTCSRADGLFSSSSSPPSLSSSFLSSSSSPCSSSSSTSLAFSPRRSSTTSLSGCTHHESSTRLPALSLPSIVPLENRLSFHTTCIHGAPPPVFSPYVQISREVNDKKIRGNVEQQSSTSSSSRSRKRQQPQNRRLSAAHDGKTSLSSPTKNSISSASSSSCLSLSLLVPPSSSCPVSTAHSSRSCERVASHGPPQSSVEAAFQSKEAALKKRSEGSREKGKEHRGKEDTKNLVLLHLARLALLALGGTRKKGRRRLLRSREACRGGEREEAEEEAGGKNLSRRCKKGEERREDEVKPSYRSGQFTKKSSDRHACNDDLGGGGGGATCKEIGDYICEILHYPDTPSFRSNLSRLLRECCVFHDTSFIKQVRRGVYTLTPHAIASSALHDSPLRVFRRSFFRTIPSLSHGVSVHDGSQGSRTQAVLNKLKEISESKERKNRRIDLKTPGHLNRNMLSSSEIHKEEEEREEASEEEEERRKRGSKKDISSHGHNGSVEEIDRNTRVASNKSLERARKRERSSLHPSSSPSMPQHISSLPSSSSVKAEEEEERRGRVAGYLSVYKGMHSPGRALCYLPGGYAYAQSQEGRDAEALAVVNALQRLAKKSSPTPRGPLPVKRRGQSTCGEKGQSTVIPEASFSSQRPKRCDEKKTLRSQGPFGGVINEEVQMNERNGRTRKHRTSIPHPETFVSLPVSPSSSPFQQNGETDDDLWRKRREDNHMGNGEVSKQIRQKKKVTGKKDVNEAHETLENIACMGKTRSGDAKSIQSGSHTLKANDSLCSHSEENKKKREKEDTKKSQSSSVSAKEKMREQQLLFSSPCESLRRNQSHLSTSQDSRMVGNKRQRKKGSMKTSLGRNVLSKKEPGSTDRSRRKEQEKEEEGSSFLPMGVERLSLAFSPSHQSETFSSMWAFGDAPSSRLVKGKETPREDKKEEADAEKDEVQDNLPKTNTVEKRNTQTPTPVSPFSPPYSPVSSSFPFLPLRVKSQKKSKKRRKEKITKFACHDVSLKTK
ncbi:hypothetical protein CSUI_007400 [Cystoisospora suis]|uniref:Uncharacterized protein n=1 Tax=Cystoisospora suis TaxID=483139 RepID=A0A2C6JV58_9APIC|nr:hypothetical protein CSUI_007400 [Cystoisospora suis]